MSCTDARDHRPLKPLEYLVLLVLARVSLHGYGVVQAIREETDGAVDLEPGNLYRHVRALESAELIVETEPPRDTPERRRYYRATELGREVLALEAARLRGLVEAAEAAVRGR